MSAATACAAARYGVFVAERYAQCFQDRNAISPGTFPVPIPRDFDGVSTVHRRSGPALPCCKPLEHNDSIDRISVQHRRFLFSNENFGTISTLPPFLSEEAMGRAVYRIETRRTSVIVRSMPMVATEISNPWWRRRRGCNLGGRAAAQPRQPLRRNCSPGRRGRRGAPERYALRDRPRPVALDTANGPHPHRRGR